MADSYGKLLTQHEMIGKKIDADRQAAHFTLRQIHSYETAIPELEAEVKAGTDPKAKGQLDHVKQMLKDATSRFTKLRARWEKDLKAEMAIEKKIKAAGGHWVDKHSAAADRAKGLK